MDTNNECFSLKQSYIFEMKDITNYFHLMGMKSSAYARHRSHSLHLNSTRALNVLDETVASFSGLGNRKPRISCLFSYLSL